MARRTITILLTAALAAGCGVADTSDDNRSSTAPLNATAYPFGARIDAYRYGIKANHVSSAQMDNTIKAHYDEWKARLVVDVPTVPGGKAVKFQDNYITVSEGIGSGMLLTVLMAGHDAQAQTIFDGFLKTARARPAYSIPNASARPYLMDWRLTADGSSTDAAGGGWNALDGDEDIAMALLMADRQWGSAGGWNYKQEGIATVNAMKAWNMKPDGTPMANGRTSRTSDYMIGHFRAYAQATGDAFWNTAIDRTYWLIDRMQNAYSPDAGLMPDFIIDTDTPDPRPSPGGQIESATEGFYFANGQRNPWRWGTDYVFSGDVRWQSVLKKMSSFFVRENGGTPGAPGTTWEPIGNMAIGYHLDGSRMTEYSPWPARGVVAGAMNGAQVDASFQSYVNASWDWLDAKWVPSYYDAELTLLSMIVASGNWWNPTAPGGQAPTALPPPPASPSPTTSASSTRIEAENGSLSGALSVHTDLGDYEGTGFVGSFTNDGDRLTVSFANIAAGTYDLRIRYHAWTPQLNDVALNGESRSESFPATGSSWAVKTISGVTLTAGTNVVAMVKDWGYTDIDYIELGVAALDGTTTPKPTATP